MTALTSISVSSTIKALLFVPFVFFLSISSFAQDSGFFLDNWQEKTAELPSSEIAVKPTESPSITVTMDANVIVNKVSDYIYGNNAVSWDNGLRSNTTAMTDLKNLNPHVLRFPGGSLSDNYFWNVDYNQRPDDIPATIDSPWYGMNTQSWQMSVDNYYDLRERTNCNGVIIVNYGYARYGTGPTPVATAAHMAAEWVRYDNGRTKFWEIGNENFGSWESGYEIDLTKNQDGQPKYITGQLYGQHCRVFLDSMRAAAAEVGADIKIGVVVFDAETSWNDRETNWNEQVMPEVGHLADFLSVHSYFTPYNTDSPASVILNSHSVPHEIKTVLTNDMTESGQTMLPVAMTEWNIFAVGSMQQVSYINGMLSALVLGEFIKNDYGMANRWDLVNGWSNGNGHAMFSTGGEPGVDPYNPRAMFFYMYYFQKFFGDRMVNSSVSGNNAVVAYASTFSSGEAGLVLINKSKTSEIALIETNAVETGLNYYTYTLTGGVDNGEFSRKVLINGIETDEEGGGPDNYATLKADAFMVDGGIKVKLPPLGVVYVMIDKKGPLSYVSSKTDSDPNTISIKFSEEIKLLANPAAVEITLNGITPLSISSMSVDPSDNKVLNVLVEESLYRNNILTVSYSGSDIVSLSDVPVQPFTNMQVINEQPGDPFSIRIQIKNSSNDAMLSDCEISLNGETKITDNLGEALFSAPYGQYELNVSRQLFNSLENQTIDISSDTLISFSLDSVLFNVSFHLSDMESGVNLSHVFIKNGSMESETNSSGIAMLRLHGARQTLNFEKQNYNTKQSSFDILSDTSLEVELERSHATVKFSLRYQTQPVSNAEVVFDGKSLFTNAVGVCIFEAVPVETSKSYSVTKEKFFTVDGSLSASNDTTVLVQMEKSVANIEFVVSTENEALENAFLIIEQDTVWLDKENTGTFYNLPINQEYTFSLLSNNYSEYTQSIFHTGDTSIHILFTTSKLRKAEKGMELHIYPNPSSGKLVIESVESGIHSVELIGISGKRFLFEKFSEAKQFVELDLNVPAGLYYLRSQTENRTVSSKLIIQ